MNDRVGSSYGNNRHQSPYSSFSTTGALDKPIQQTPWDDFAKFGTSYYGSGNQASTTPADSGGFLPDNFWDKDGGFSLGLSGLGTAAGIFDSISNYGFNKDRINVANQTLDLQKEQFGLAREGLQQNQFDKANMLATQRGLTGDAYASALSGYTNPAGVRAAEARKNQGGLTGADRTNALAGYTKPAGDRAA